MDWLQYLFSGAIDSLLFFLPAITYNLTIYLYGMFVLKGDMIPLDNGMVWHSKPVIGPGRGVEGLYVAILIGSLWSIGLTNDAKPLCLTIGANAGTIVSSFIKRRLGKPRGRDLFPLDNIDFIIGASFLYTLQFPLPYHTIAFGLGFAGAGHLLINLLIRPLFERYVVR